MSSTVLPLISELVKLLPEAVAVNPGLAYLSGLLHDFGYLALGHLFPARFFLFNHFLAVNPRLPLSAVERYMLGVEHWHIGAWVMQTWSMPEEVIAAVRWHHSEDCTQPHAEYSNLVLIANRLLQHIGLGEEHNHRLPALALFTLGLARDQALEALARVRGFSPSEMALPNHPDIAYEYIKTLKDCGYQWLLVQEHTVERPENGWGPEKKHLPHRLVCTNSRGETVSIIAIIKTQGSDTKLVAQMQPYYEAKGLSRWELAGKSVPPLVTQIADGENGGVMMNEFPGMFCQVTHEATGSDVPMMNATEYLEHLFASGIKESDLPVLQPLFQKRIWDRFKPGDGPEKLEKTIVELKKEDGRFHMEGGSWTNDISWVRGYDNVLGPMEKASSDFYEQVLKPGVAPSDPRYRNALFHLMCSQTSCYRYWGQGLWTDYGRELCRRASAIVETDF